MTTNSIRFRPTAAGVALLAALTLGACGSDGDSVQNDPVDDSSETTPGEDENEDLDDDSDAPSDDTPHPSDDDTGGTEDDSLDNDNQEGGRQDDN